jgi:hypothetical protein
MIGLSALADARPDDLIKLLAPIFQQLVEGNQASGDKSGKSRKTARPRKRAGK